MGGVSGSATDVLVTLIFQSSSSVDSKIVRKFLPLEDVLQRFDLHLGKSPITQAALIGLLEKRRLQALSSRAVSEAWRHSEGSAVDTG